LPCQIKIPYWKFDIYKKKNNFTKVAKNLAKDKKDENNFARLSK